MTTVPRKVFVLTGKRGGFGAMKPMLRILRDDPAFELQLVVTDQHVDPKFGATAVEVKREFPIAASVPMDQADATAAARARAVGTCMREMSDVLARLAPDICVLYGDRGEVMATALAATLLGLPIAHVQGGDVSGSLDENMRHAATKLAHLHFPSTEASAERIRRMGEEPWRVRVVGDNHIDLIVAGEFDPPAKVAAALELDLSRPVVVVLQHSETTAPGEAYAQMTETLAAVRAVGHQAVIVHPCSDQGYDGILKAIDEVRDDPRFKVFVNLDAPLFWGLLNVAAVMVGNSSAGLIETPSFHLPAIDVGRRQVGRLRAENVIHAEHDRGAIAGAMRTALEDKDFRGRAATCSQPFGDGRAGARIAAALKDAALDRRLMLKQITY